MLLCSVSVSYGAGIKVVPSAARVSPGESFFIDITVENIPPEGLGAVQFRLNVDAPGSVVTVVSDTTLGRAGEVSVATPLIIGPPTSTRSGIGEFFWNATGLHGILVMDNEELKNGSALYTFGHTNGASPPQGSGSVARFSFAVGKDVTAERIHITLSEVMLLDAGTAYPLDSNTGATIELRCMATVPNLLGLSQNEAQVALQKAGLLIGTISEIDNWSGTYALNKVLNQSLAPGTSVLCETPVDLAINTAPSEVSNTAAVDKAGDESGTVVLSWLPSSSADTAGYRVYLVPVSQSLLKEIRNPAATGVEIPGLPNGQVSQLKIAVFDSFGNESRGVIISAMSVDDVPPRVTIGGVAEGAYYSSNVLPVITVEDANLSTKEITLNGVVYNLALISVDGNYTLRVVARDVSGNTTTREVHFVVDKTPPVISVTGIEKGRYYNVDLRPVITVTDANLLKADTFLNGIPYTSGSAISAEGTYELRIEAVDKAGNSSRDAYTFSIDKTKPTSSIAVGEPRFENNGKMFVTRATLFTLTGRDAGVVVSGIAKLEYRMNNGVWNTYQAPFALSDMADGLVTIDYRAVDIAGNIEDMHTLTVNSDSTPPVTTLSIGEPKFTAADGKLYVTPVTVITLSASDNLSGVAKTEYRIDNGQWLAYAPFTMSSEGSHTIGYRSSDNLGNVETEKTLGVIADNTPPVSTIDVGTPQYKADGKLYINGTTEISISATDTGSGIKRTEYAVDSTSFTAYTGSITLAAYPDGSHTITYRSTDNLGNVESAKNLVVVLDKTPPKTSISASDPLTDGVINVVSPGTRFSLSSSDNFSGVKEIRYRIDGGAWQTYVSSFSLSEMNAGEHAIAYKAADNVLNEETEKSITLKLVVIEVTKTVSDEAIVLAAAWHLDSRSDKDDHGKDDGDKKDKEHILSTLTNMLSSSGIAYHIPQSDEEFRETLRSGRFNTYILIDFKDEDIGDEIREAVNYGEGLVFIKTRPDDDPDLDDVFGVKFKGKSEEGGLTVNLVQSPISYAGTLQTGRENKVVKTEITSPAAQVFGYVMDKNKTYPVIVLNRYGKGKVILFSFDLLNCPDQVKAEDLLLNSINYVKPVEHYVRALESVPVRIRISNSTAPVDLRIAETIPNGTSADTVFPQATQTGRTITWQKSLNASEKATFGYSLNLPDLKGDYTTTTEVKYSNNGDYRLYGIKDLTITVPYSSAELLQTIIAELNAVAPPSKKDAERIEEAIEHLHAIKTNASNRKQAEENIKEILDAIEEIRKLSFNTSEIRLKLDEMLKIWEGKWCLLN